MQKHKIFEVASAMFHVGGLSGIGALIGEGHVLSAAICAIVAACSVIAICLAVRVAEVIFLPTNKTKKPKYPRAKKKQTRQKSISRTNRKKIS